VGARDVREKQVSRVSLRGHLGGGEVKGRGIVWYFKMKEVEVWQFCLYGTRVPNITVLKSNIKATNSFSLGKLYFLYIL